MDVLLNQQFKRNVGVAEHVIKTDIERTIGNGSATLGPITLYDEVRGIFTNLFQTEDQGTMCFQYREHGPRWGVWLNEGGMTPPKYDKESGYWKIQVTYSDGGAPAFFRNKVGGPWEQYDK